ncbi:Ataxin-3 [Seminavis robusta]|uniref:ubiquitinyl hydrolase 1 n=1 Tax=Seminavis robusta TaxID=568900 RepID=A0A9N8DPZ4_9STRA|nr:Ataxin-3 [Seminavis robusta]|eukprot:Sro288_g108830.1 Ataxin-3 (381) ;mRNA; f:48459-49729
MSGSNGSSDVWIYHEKQESLLCGQHSLNNLVQYCEFTPDTLAIFAHELDELELNFMAENNEGGVKSKDYLERVNEGSGNVDPHGNFSIQVLRRALQKRYGLELPSLKEEGYAKKEPTTMEGFICNKHSHWFAIRKINGRYWNLNSTKDRPELISYFDMATELKEIVAAGYSVFVVPPEKTLPPACTGAKEMQQRKAAIRGGVEGNWWREADLLTPGAAGANNKNGSQDPWKNVGSGMRLDGKSTVPESPLNWRQPATHGMSEEEQLQFAVAASLESPKKIAKTEPAAGPDLANVTVPPEPAAGTAGSVRIQFRLPSKPRVVRRFMETDSVAVILKYCTDMEGGKSLDLLYGFPPKDLKPLAEQTIGDAKLAGESIQGRAV